MSGWERLATFEGGTVTSLARAQAADGSWHVFAATPVGVFRSIDRGRTWAPLGTGSRVAGAEVVAAAPRYAEDGIVYVGAHDGVYRWQPDTAGWQRILTDCVVECIALDAGDREARPDGSGLTVFVGTREDGILVSRNGGRTWAGANAGLLSLCVFDLALSPSLREDGIAFAATADGLYRTRNGAESWRQVDTDTDDDEFDAVAVSPTFSEDRVVLASSYNIGVYRSDDAGRSWTHIEEADGFMVLGVDFWSGERAVAWTVSGVALSTDGGQSWQLDWKKQEARGVEMVTSAVLLPGVNGGPDDILAAAGRAGVVRSEDGGETWTPSASGLTAALVSDLLLSPNFADDQTLYALSLGDEVQISTDAGQTWSAVEFADAADAADDDAIDDEPARGPGGGIGKLAVIASPGGGRTLIGAANDGLHLSDDDGAHWQPAWEDTPVTSMEVPFESIHAVATATTADGVHILTDIKARGMEWSLVGSRDGGLTWTELPTPVKRAFVDGLAVTPDAGLDGALYVATHADWDGDLTLWHSPDGGRRWHSWFAEPEARASVAKPLVALPANQFGDTVVLALGNRVLRPRQNAWEVKGGVRRPVWDTTELTNEELPGRPASIAGLTASPAYAQDRTLFVATSAGVYVSRDGGASFVAWSDGLEPAAMVAVALSPRYATDRLVYGLGLGGTIWRRVDR